MSWRSTISGTWFASELSKIIREYPGYDLEYLLKLVQQNISQKVAVFPDGRKAKQSVSWILNNVSKKLLLKGNVLCNSIEEKHQYSKKSTNKGFCLIFNNYNFNNNDQNRIGSHKDAELYGETFKSLGFEILLYKNLTASQIFKVLDDTKVKECSALVTVFLSHGNGNTIEASDTSFPLTDILRRISNAEASALIGKPKIIILSTVFEG